MKGFCWQMGSVDLFNGNNEGNLVCDFCQQQEQQNK